MTPHLTNLIALRDAVKDGRDPEHIATIAWDIFCGEPDWAVTWPLAIDASTRRDMNAALAFHATVLPGYAAQVDTFGNACVWPFGDVPEVIDRKDLWKWAANYEAHVEGNPAVALFLADMAALIAIEEGKG